MRSSRTVRSATHLVATAALCSALVLPDDIERAGGPGTLYAVDQATGNIYRIDTAQVEPGTLFVSQPAPKSGDLPNDPALGILDPHTGVVTHVDSTMGSPKGLLFVPEHGRGSDEK